MLGLILVVLVVGRIVYCIWRKKGIFDSGKFICAAVMIVLCILFGILTLFINDENINSIPEYQEANQEIQAQMQELKEEFVNIVLENPEQAKENFESIFDEYATKYGKLKSEFEVNEETIKTNTIIRDYGQARIKFLLYFGH